jgi:hypothetical protein
MGLTIDEPWFDFRRGQRRQRPWAYPDFSSPFVDCASPPPGSKAAGAWSWPHICLVSGVRTKWIYTSTPYYIYVACTETPLPFFFFSNLLPRCAPGLFSWYSDWTFRGTNAGGSEIFRTRPDRSCGFYPASRKWVPGFFPDGKAVGFWRWTPTLI